jgi:hypothetical protein
VGLARLLPAAGHAQPRLRVEVDNALGSRRQFASGYSYQYFTDNGSGHTQPGGTRYYFPLATRSVVVMLDLKL